MVAYRQVSQKNKHYKKGRYEDALPCNRHEDQEVELEMIWWTSLSRWAFGRSPTQIRTNIFPRCALQTHKTLTSFQQAFWGSDEPTRTKRQNQ